MKRKLKGKGKKRKSVDAALNMIIIRLIIICVILVGMSLLKSGLYDTSVYKYKHPDYAYHTTLDLIIHQYRHNGGN